MSNSLKSVFTDIADATEEVLNVGDGFYGERTLPNIIRNLNNIDHSYNIDLPNNYDKDYNACIKALGDVIRARRFTTVKFTLPEMPVQIRQINGRGDQEREYLVGNRIKNTTHTECVANYSYYNWDLYPGQVVYVSVPSQNSLEKAIVMKSDNRIWVDDDGGYYDYYSVISISTPHFVYKKDSRYSSPTITGTVATNPNTPFSVYKDILNYWTTIECYADLYKESGTYDPVEVYLYFTDWGADKMKLPTSIDLRVDWVYDGSTGTGSVRIDTEYDSYSGTATAKESGSSSYGDPVLRNIRGTITGNFGGTTETIEINNYY